MAIVSSPMASSRHFFGPLSTIKTSSHQTNLYDIVQNPYERVTVLVSKRQAFFRHQLKQEEYLQLKHLELVSLVFHPPDGHQRRQEGVQLQLEFWSK